MRGHAQQTKGGNDDDDVTELANSSRREWEEGDNVHGARERGERKEACLH